MTRRPSNPAPHPSQVESGRLPGTMCESTRVPTPASWVIGPILDEGGVPDLLGVHDGGDVLGLLFDRGHVVDGIGEPETAALETDGARTGGEAFEERVHVRIGPQQVQMHLDLEEPHDVGGAGSGHPVGRIVTIAG